MARRIIKINEENCDGCGQCVPACSEGVIEMERGKAKLAREDYCDGLGDCLPACPRNAISIQEREERANREKCSTGCTAANRPQTAADRWIEDEPESCLSQWPVQIRLVSENASYFNGADLLIAADCTAYAFGDFHNRFIRDRITLIGCPRQEEAEYESKLAMILKWNDIQSITIVRMQVPCCGGLEQAVLAAVKRSKKDIPCQTFAVTINGMILE